MNTGKIKFTVRVLSLTLTVAMLFSLMCVGTPAVAATTEPVLNLEDFVTSGLSEIVSDYDGDGKALTVKMAAGSKGSGMKTVKVENLDPNGVYELTAWIKNETTIASGYITATVKNDDDTSQKVEYKDANFLKSAHSTWSKYVVSNITSDYENFTLEIGMWANNSTGETDFECQIDKITLTRIPDPATTLNFSETTNGLAKPRTDNTGGVSVTYTPTRVTGATGIPSGDGVYVHYDAVYHSGRGRYMIYPQNTYSANTLDPNKTYTVEFWLRSSGGFNDAKWSVNGYNLAQDKYLEKASSVIAKQALPEWTKVTLTGITTEKKASGDVNIFLGGWIYKVMAETAGTELWIDIDGAKVYESFEAYEQTFDLSQFTNSAATLSDGDADGDGKYLQINIPHTTDSATAGNFHYASKHEALDPNKTYTVAGWFKVSKVTNLGNFWVNGGGEGQSYTEKGDAYTLYTGSNNYNNGMTTEWKYYEIKNVHPSTTGNIKLGFWARKYTTSQEYVYIDGLKIYEQVDASALVTEAPAAVQDVLPQSTMLGASVRGDDEIRFGIEMSAKVWGDDVVDEIKYGTLFIPTATLGDAELTLATEGVLDVPTRLWQENLPGYEDRILYTCVLTDVPTADTAITARGYMLYRIGETWYVQYTQAASRTINGVKDAVAAAG